MVKRLLRRIFPAVGTLVWILALLFWPEPEGAYQLGFLGGLLGIARAGTKLVGKVFTKTRRPPPGRLPPPPRGGGGRRGQIIRRGGQAVTAGTAAGVVRSALRPGGGGGRGGTAHIVQKRRPDFEQTIGGARHKGQPHQALSDLTDDKGRPMVVEGGMNRVIQCPPGYVAVTIGFTRGGEPRRACMLKGPAQRAGLWKRRRKPPISAGDWRKLKVAKRIKKKARKIAETAGGKVKGLPRK